MMKEWQTKRLGDVCEIIKGRKPALKATSSNGDLPYLVAKVMRGSKEAEYASATDRNSITVEESETIIICDGSNSGEVFTGFRGILSSTMGKIAKKAVIDDDYLRAFLTSTFDVFNGAKTGAAIPHLDKEAMYQLQFPFPPVAEQQRIVGLLDEAFEGLATAKANAEKNLQNARALFESHLQSVFTQRGPGWVEKRLEDVCGLQNGFAFKSSTFKPSGAPILRISNIQDGRIEAGNRLVFFDPKDYRENLDRYRIVEDDLLIAMSGATTGKLGFNTESTVYYLNQRVGKFEPSEKLNKRFLYHFLSTKVEENLRISAGAAQPNLSTEQIKGFVLPLPSIEEQEHVVEALEALSEETQRLARLYERKLAALEALKKSLLHQAFTGEL